MWIYKSSAVVVSSSEYVCSIVSNEHLVSLTLARLPTTICHWIEVTMYTYFGSSAICTSKSFDNTCNATQTTHLYVISVLFLFFFSHSLDSFHYDFYSFRISIQTGSLFISAWNVTIVNGLWLSQWGEKVFFFSLKEYWTICTEGRKERKPILN